MIKKLIFTSLLTPAMAHGSVDKTLFSDIHTEVKETKKYSVWTPSIAKKPAGDSCENGNCLSDLNCMTKDGMMYKFFTSVRDKVKKQCKKL